MEVDFVGLPFLHDFEMARLRTDPDARALDDALRSHDGFVGFSRSDQLGPRSQSDRIIEAFEKEAPLMFPIPRFRQGLRVLSKSSPRMDERVEGPRPFHEARLKLGLVAGPGRIPQVVVQLADVPGQLPVERREGNRHVRSPGRDGPPTKKGSPSLIRGPGLRTARLPAAAS